MTIKERRNASPEQSARRSVGPHLGVDESCADVAFAQIGQFTDFTHSIDLRGPIVGVRDVNQSGVEGQERAASFKLGIDLTERLARELSICRAADLRIASTEDGFHDLSLWSHHVTVRQREDLVSIGHQAAGARDALDSLRRADDRKAAANEVIW